MAISNIRNNFYDKTSGKSQLCLTQISNLIQTQHFIKTNSDMLKLLKDSGKIDSQPFIHEDMRYLIDIFTEHGKYLEILFKKTTKPIRYVMVKYQ